MFEGVATADVAINPVQCRAIICGCKNGAYGASFLDVDIKHSNANNGYDRPFDFSFLTRCRCRSGICAEGARPTSAMPIRGPLAQARTRASDRDAWTGPGVEFPQAPAANGFLL